MEHNNTKYKINNFMDELNVNLKNDSNTNNEVQNKFLLKTERIISSLNQIIKISPNNIYNNHKNDYDKTVNKNINKEIKCKGEEFSFKINKSPQKSIKFAEIENIPKSKK